MTNSIGSTIKVVMWLCRDPISGPSHNIRDDPIFHLITSLEKDEYSDYDHYRHSDADH